jgi:tetratricopeptide (TPR) repeat protein
MMFWREDDEVEQPVHDPNCIPGSNTSETKVKSDEHFVQALKLYHNNMLDDAIGELSLAIDINSTDSKLFATRGILLCRKNLFDDAIQDFTQAVSLNPKDSYSFNNRGIAYLQSGKLKEALEDCNRAVGLTPSSAAARCNRGTVYLAMEKVEEAMQDLDTAIELEPRNSTIFTIRGRVHHKLNNLDLSIRDFSCAIRIAPTNLCALYDRGRILMKQQEFVLASRDFHRIKQLAVAGDSSQEQYCIMAHQQLEVIVSQLEQSLDLLYSSSEPVSKLSGTKRKLMEFQCNSTTSDPESESRQVRPKLLIPDMFCPITMEVMRDPVVAEDGHSYERLAIELWLVTNHHTSPLTNQPLRNLQLVPNHTLKKCIQFALSNSGS